MNAPHVLMSVRFLKGVGPLRAEQFASMGIHTVEDLLEHFPRRYEDRSNFAQIGFLQEGATATIKARVVTRSDRRSWKRRSFSIFQALVSDSTGQVMCVWFNQPYLKHYFKPGQEVILYGRVERWGNRLQMVSPEFELCDASEKGTQFQDRIVGIYSLPQGISQRFFRSLMHSALTDHLKSTRDFLSLDIQTRHALPDRLLSLSHIHFPDNFTQQQEAYRRFSFEEFLLYQIPLALRKVNRAQKRGIAHVISNDRLNTFINNLPFSLTNSQSKAVEEIRENMAQSESMQRLLQGDVGSGKTIVALIAAMISVGGGFQVAFLVPTEVLAMQHFQKIKDFIGKNSQFSSTKVALFVGSQSADEKKEILSLLNSHQIDIVIGTHALLDSTVHFKRLGLVVIDEQHKFGVGQRALLPLKGDNPDCLIMTATPIPRTLAITLYGDLDVTVINELPKGRKKIITRHFSSDYRDEAFACVRQELASGHQVYIVYPVIEESIAFDSAGAKQMYEDLKSGLLKDFKIGLLHGKLNDQKQQKVIEQFRKGHIQVLVSTTILEVGVDNPNATCMVIENAERFGLSQLHQLRGRVGRSDIQSYCILISDVKTQESKARMNAMLESTDGFKLAEEDLKIRGPGEFFGQRQHGLTELKIANPLTQLQLLKNAREEALRLVKSDPVLANHHDLRQKLLKRFPEYEKVIMVG